MIGCFLLLTLFAQTEPAPHEPAEVVQVALQSSPVWHDLPFGAREYPKLLSVGLLATDGALPATRLLRFCSESDSSHPDSPRLEGDAPRIGVGIVRAVAGATQDTGPTVDLAIGPVLLAPSDLPARGPESSIPWWTAGVALGLDTSVAKAPAPMPHGSIDCEDALGRLSAVIPRDAKALDQSARRHRHAVEELLAARDAANGDRAGVPPEAIEAPGLAADLFDVVTWLELSDARQAVLRRRGEVTAADAVVKDMQAFLKILKAPGLESLLSERVPSGTEGFASLVLHESWQTDAWQLVEPVLRLSASLDRTKREFASLAERVARDANLAPEALKELKARLATVARNMPPGFEWTQRFEEDCEAHMRKAFTAGAEFGGAPRAPAFDPANPLVASIYARTVAFEIFGYAWAQPNAMLPSMQAERQARLAQAVAPLEEAVRTGSLTTRSGVDQGRIALDLIASYLSSEDARWKPWVVFPPSEKIAGYAAREVFAAVESAVRRFDDGAEPGLPDPSRISWDFVVWDLDCALSVEGGMNAGTSGQRPWIFPDCAMMFWDGYVPLRKW